MRTELPTRTHVSLDARSLPESVRFYTALFGAGPFLERADYARFVADAPPLVLGLNAVGRGAGTVRAAAGVGSPLQHLGVAFADEAELERARERLLAIDAALEDEPDVVCCYARMRRAWVADPDGVRWELLVAREEVVDAPARVGPTGACCA